MLHIRKPTPMYIEFPAVCCNQALTLKFRLLPIRFVSDQSDDECDGDGAFISLSGVGRAANSVRQSRRFPNLDSCRARHVIKRRNTRFAETAERLAIFRSLSAVGIGYPCRRRAVFTDARLIRKREKPPKRCDHVEGQQPLPFHWSLSSGRHSVSGVGGKQLDLGLVPANSLRFG
jgi:hypothetical protein